MTGSPKKPTVIEANALDPAEPLYPGQELQIPGGAGGAEDVSAGAQWYTVQEGDTLEIGVAGFPPARYAFVPSDAVDAVNWRPIGLAA